jgi:hypothetical protein
MNKISIPATLPQQVEEAKALDISYRTLHPGAVIINSQNKEAIKIPFSSLINKYKDFLHEIIIEMPMDEDDCETFMYKPKMLSEDLYGTTELWDTILILNNTISVSEFKPEGKVKIYDPNRLKKYINEILIMEEILE